MSRRPQFRVHTKIDRHAGACSVRKVADHSDAKPFLREIIDREALAERFYAGHATVCSGVLRNDCIEYPFLPYPTLEEQLDRQICTGDPEAALQILRRYVDFLDGFPSEEFVPREFLGWIGTKEIACRCFSAGPIDCIPRNIMIENEDWYVIDHEWMLEDPIPVDLVAYLGISSLIFGLQTSIQSCVDSIGPVEIFAGRYRRFYAPVAWLELMRESALPIELLNDWYFGFQKQILVDASPRVLRHDPHRYSRIPGSWNPMAMLSDLKALSRSFVSGQGSS